MTARPPPVALLAGALTPLCEAASVALAEAGFRLTLLEDGAEAARVFRSIAEELGPVTCLVNSATLQGSDTALTTSQALLGSQLATGVMQPALLARSFAETLPADTRGLIINLVDRPLSETAPEPFAGMLSGLCLGSLTKLLAQALAPRIRVNLIAPGPALPALRPPAIAPDEAARHVGAAVRYLLTAEAVTGELIALDLGESGHS